MARPILLAAFALAALFSTDHAASAQVVAYHHRSTVWGDHLAGASELVRAQGAYLRDEAAAAETWVNVAASYDALMYQRREIYFQERQMYLEYLKAKAAARRERDAAKAASDEVAAVELWQQARHGAVAWPAALARPEYAGSMTLIESILRNYSPDDAANSAAYRQSLATEAAVLRTRVGANANLSFEARLEAVRTLRRLQVLASTPELASTAAQLAMR